MSDGDTLRRKKGLILVRDGRRNTHGSVLYGEESIDVENPIFEKGTWKY